MDRLLATLLRLTFMALLAAIFTNVASSQTETTLYSFPGGSGGAANPQAGLISDSKGNLYGTALGGTGFSGSVFELVLNSNGTFTEQTLYSFLGFDGNSADGALPSGGLVFDSKGNLYGTTWGGGPANAGTVFELSPGSNGSWTERVLYSFAGGSDASFPYQDGIVFDGAGNIYGTTYEGGAYGYGSVYELVAGTNGTWSEKVLYSFKGLNDGGHPLSCTPVLDTAGNLYGATGGGGLHDYGVVYKLTRGSNGNWTEKVIYSFPGGAGGAFPLGSPIFDTADNLYGTTQYTVYELSPSSNGTWKEKTLHSFSGSLDGADSNAGLVFDKAGNLYGTTFAGGAHRGTVFELTPGSNGAWSEKVLHAFSSTGGDGLYPQFANLLVDASGNVYGVTAGGGASNSGAVFKIAP